MDNLEIKLLKEESDMAQLWMMFDCYIHELAENCTQGDGIELEYFTSDEYRDAVNNIRKRDRNPIRIYFIMSEGRVIGFSMYQLLFDEDNSTCLMEYYLPKEFRNKGWGKYVYKMIEEKIADEGIDTIELTPTNEVNRRFWEGNGYVITDDLDDDNKHISRKSLKVNL